MFLQYVDCTTNSAAFSSRFRALWLIHIDNTSRRRIAACLDAMRIRAWPVCGLSLGIIFSQTRVEVPHQASHSLGLVQVQRWPGFAVPLRPSRGSLALGDG